MRIGIDVRKLYDSGIGTYIRILLGHLPAASLGDTFVLLVDPAHEERARRQFANDRFEWHASSSGKYSLNEALLLGRHINTLNLDVFHSPHFTLPFGLAPARVVAIHDLIPLRFPRYFSTAKRIYARTMMWHACRAADIVITGSHHTKGDIAAEFGVDLKKIRVIYHGTPQEFRVLPIEERDKFRSRFELTRPYALYAGNFKPHKNLALLLQAFAAVPEAVLPHLVLVGDSLKKDDGLRELIAHSGLADRVKMPGHLTSEELIRAYNAARMVVFASRYEGFGFPALEAMACGTPLIAARATSLPEVVGQAGLLFDPDDAAELTAKLQLLATDDTLHADLRARGLERVLEFPVERCAAQTMDVYREVVS